MSVMGKDGIKRLLPRTGPDQFWQTIHRHFAREDPAKWKHLAMLALRENAGWPLEHIGAVFGHPKGHVARCLVRIKKQLRRRFRMSPNVLELSSEDELD